MARMMLPTRLVPLAAVLLACVAPLAAQPTVLPGQEATEMEGVGIVQKLDEIVPSDLAFTNSKGEPVTIADFMGGEQPFILTLNYYRCPMLCSLTLNGMIDGLRELDWSAGEQFQIVTVSIDPEEGSELASQKKKAYLSQYDRESAVEGWSFLTGEQDQITQLAEAVGFGYRYDDNTGEYAHSSSIIFVTPEGRISRYMNDVSFKPRDLRLALVESSEGRIGSAMDTLLLFNCFQWDPESNSYIASAWKIMRLGGVVTVILVVFGLFVLGFRSNKGSGGGQPPTVMPSVEGGLS